MNKKKLSVLSFLLILLFCTSFTITAEEIEDLPVNHWAYESVNTLIDRGYLDLYDDDTFRGDNTLTRYEMAVIIARMLEDIQTDTTRLTEDDVEQIRKLSLEFRDELVDFAEEQEDFSKALENIREQNIIHSEEIGQVNEQIRSIQDEISNIVDNILEMKKMENEINELQNDIKTIEKELHEARVDILLKEENIEKLKAQIEQSVNRKLEDQDTITQTKIHSLENRINELEGKLEEDSENGRSNMPLYIGGAAALTLILLTS